MSSTSYTHSPVAPAGARASGHHGDVSPSEVAVGVIIGRSSEYFDFFVFGIACVLVFPQVLFPFLPRLDGMLMAFAIFSLAFIARPFGTALSMAIQRRWGLAVKLTIALFLLGSSTVSMALLPSYESAGAAAIWALVVLRVGQGLAQGGSWDGLRSLLAMTAPENRRGWYAMIGQLGAPIGFILAAALFAYFRGQLSEAEFLDWGWRYPFCVAFAINVVALFARLRLVVDPSYAAMLEQRDLEPVKVRELLDTEGGTVAIDSFAALAGFALFHLVTVFALSWGITVSAQPVGEILSVQIAGAVCAAVGMVVAGALADRFGRQGILLGVTVLIGLFSLVTPVLLAGGSAGQNVFILAGFILLGLSYGQSSGVVTSNLPRRLRYTGAAISTDVAWLIGAAFAPLVAMGLSARFGPVAAGLYLLSGVVCTLIALWIGRSAKPRE
ncbi:MAG: MFS transporter [Ottowia sp.]|uniref:MFS transporter n=1 Tax=Ottowia sp. TaxID=1898956 RepID=UPI0039E699B1